MTSAIPDIPQDVSAFKVTPSSGDDCIIVVNWNPPSNANTSLVKQYMIESPSVDYMTTKTAIAVALLIHQCEVGSNTHIRIHAIDSCNRNGTSSDNIITDLLETTNNSSGGVTTQQNPIAEGLGKLCVDTLLVHMCVLRVIATIMSVCMVSDWTLLLVCGLCNIGICTMRLRMSFTCNW